MPDCEPPPPDLGTVAEHGGSDLAGLEAGLDGIGIELAVFRPLERRSLRSRDLLTGMR